MRADELPVRETPTRSAAAKVEPLLFMSRALFGERSGPLAVLARGHDAHEPGALGITASRILFLGDGGAQLVVERRDVLRIGVEPDADGDGCDVRAETVAGGFVLREVSSGVEDVLASPPWTDAHVRERPPVPAEARPAAARRAAPRYWPAVGALAAAAIWFASIAGVDTRDVGDLGLVTALPVWSFFALALICAAFAGALARPRPGNWLLAAPVLALVAMLYGAPSLVAEVAPFHVTWRHSGITQYILDHGGVDASINAYFNWPSAFALFALLTDLSGVGSPADLGTWAPLVLNLLYLPPLLLIGRAMSDDPRLPWAGAWVFYLANWVYQDYLSPQGLVLLLYLSVAAILLTWFTRPGNRRLPATQQAALAVATVTLVAAAVPGHQLTPFAILAAATALAIVRIGRFRALPAIVLVLTVTWAVFGAGPYLSGHFEKLTEEIGKIGSTVDSNVGGRVKGSPDHVVVTSVRIGTSLALYGLAAFAAVTMLRRGRRQWLAVAVLAAAPASLVALQAYGGEIVLRVYLYALPFVAVLVGSMLAARARGRAPGGAAGVALMSLLLAGAFLFTRYGNDRVNLFTADEVQVVERMYELARPGSVLVAPNSSVPWEFDGIGELRHRNLVRELEDEGARTAGRPELIAGRVVELIDGEREGDGGGYVVLVRNSSDYERLFGSAPWGTIAELRAGLAGSPRFERVHASADGEIFALRGGEEAAGDE